MTPDRWQRAKELFGRAIECEGEARAALLAEGCAGDAALLREVEVLLRSHENAGAFLEAFTLPPALAEALEADESSVPARETDASRPGPTPVASSKLCVRCNSRLDASRRFCTGCGEALVDDPEALVGTTLDGLYRIEALLGQGGMGRVYRARHLLLKETVAIKLLPREWSENPVWLRRFQQEGRAARRFRQPSAVAVYDLRVTSDGIVYLVQEYVEGRTLREELRQRGRYAPEEALALLEPIARVLDAAHRAGVVHRDIKPENVMLGRDEGGAPVVKVLDFGIAKLREAAEVLASTALTGPGVVLGTALYMSPEQWGELARDGRAEIDGRADVYSLGVMTYEMVCGARPFAGENVAELRRQHASATPPAAQEVNGQVPNSYGAVIARAMAKDRADRQASAGEFIQELRAALGLAGAAAVAGPPGRPSAADALAARATLMPSGPAAAVPNNLPHQLTSYIGRGQEIADLTQMIAATRLLTLTGPGGIGKTRLALEVASRALVEYHDGVWLVELAPLSDPALVPCAVARALGVDEEPGRPPVEILRDWLEPKRLLLVLDNCEHLVEACAVLADQLLRSCAGLRVLATSREALRIGGEALWPVTALSVPGLGGQVAEGALSAYDATSLFVERARSSRREWEAGEAGAAAIAEICRLLEGIPLAIELAAARVKVLSVNEIAARLEDRLRLLTSGSRAAPERQRTMQGAITWSYDLLSDEERTLLRSLSVFAGGWTLEAAEQVGAGVRDQGSGIGEEAREGGGVAAGRDAAAAPGVSGSPSSLIADPWPPTPPDVLDLLAQLVEKSLIMADRRGGEVRYRMLETIRQYAWEKLVEAGEEPLMVERHRDYCLSLAEGANAGLYGMEEGRWLERLETEHDNMRAALRRSLRGGSAADAALRLCVPLTEFWTTRGHVSEALRWFDVALPFGANAPDALRAKALCGAGKLATVQGDMERATALFEEALTLQRALRDKRGLVVTLYHLGYCLLSTARYEQAAAANEECLALARDLGSWVMVAGAGAHLGLIALDRGDLDRAARLLDESLALTRLHGSQRDVAVMLANLGEIALRQGDLERAEGHLKDCQEVARALGDQIMFAGQQMYLGGVAVERGERDRAMTLLREALEVFREHRLRPNIARTFEAMACAVAKDDPRRALCLAGAASQLREAIGAPLPPVEQGVLDRHTGPPGRALGEEAGRAFDAGRALTLEQAIQYALAP
jgi:non-specific serine/threonine protein kinase